MKQRVRILQTNLDQVSKERGRYKDGKMSRMNSCGRSYKKSMCRLGNLKVKINRYKYCSNDKRLKLKRISTYIEVLVIHFISL